MTAYYYVKSGGSATADAGRATTARTGSFATMGASAYYDSIYDVFNGGVPSTAPVAGDVIIVSNSHSKSYTATTSVTVVDDVYIFSVDDANADTYSAGASEYTTGNYQLNYDGEFLMAGFTLEAGVSTGTGASNLRFQNSASGGKTIVLKDCKLRLAGSGGGLVISLGRNTSAASYEFFLIDCSYKFVNASQTVQYYNARAEEFGTSIESGSTTPYVLYKSTAGRQCNLISVDSDLSGISTTTALVGVGAGPTLLEFYNLRLPSSYTGGITSGTINNGERISLYNYDDGSANYKLWIEQYCGTIKTDTATYLTANDGETAISWKMTSNANASIINNGLRSPQLAPVYSSTGAKTFTVEILDDGGLNQDDVAIVTHPLLSSSYPISTYTTSLPDSLASIISGASGLTAGVGTSSWTGYATGTSGLTTPTSEKLVASPTIAMTGIMLGTVVLYKPSTTIFINPATA